MPDSARLPNQRTVLLPIALVVLAMSPILRAGFVFDDFPLIVDNAQVRAFSPPWVYAQQSYWPPLRFGDGYRPWTIWWFAIQWRMGHGAPLIFHLTSVLLAAACVALVFHLARELNRPKLALPAAALFAVHPVHAEATGLIVGQSELWVTGFSLAAALVYARARNQAGPPTRRTNFALALLLVLAVAAKEHGFLLPGLLVTVEMVVGRESVKDRIRLLWRTAVFLGLVDVALLIGRSVVLGGLRGGDPAAGLAGLGLGGRTLVMLPLLVDWARLLVWPARLRAIYTPLEFGGPPIFDLRAMLGAALLVGACLTIAWGVRSAKPVIGFGIAWCIVAGLIVSNIAFPTAALLAERTLYLSSVGIVFAGASALERVPARARKVAITLLLGLGLARSWSRHGIWRDNETAYTQMMADSPRSSVAHFLHGKYLYRQGRLEEAIAEFRQSTNLVSTDPQVYQAWGQALREADRCADAVPVLERGVAVDPRSPLAHARLVGCLLRMGRRDEARRAADRAVAAGLPEVGRMVRDSSPAPPPGSEPPSQR